ncbi:hypothetical protein BDB00DRAFT_924632 [Zychaea mexicana]|uniref:uncharacterized protein n=1 Tax=Zychaea mexicana TaxID=64656 RepID=UPI0022FDDF76|nr:uncharacterized protein BDB00DRAFT_924632 [Zychaea mexicana]KAI9499396.1 hypothetical protein BDB00DRAFT_924632 [Zychaea mexicana]
MTQKDLSGKVAVVTGGGSGLGKATASALVSRGVKVVIGDISEKLGEATVQELNAKEGGSKVASFLKTNVAKYQDNIALFQLAEKEFGGVDIAFLNAGIGRGWDSAFTELDDEADENLFNVNVMGVVKGTKVALLHLAKRGGGVIISTASIGAFSSNIGANAYCASKHAVVGWTRGFDLLPEIANVRVNAVCPAFVETNFMSAAKDETRSTPMYATHDATPKAKLETVIKAVLTLIEDETLNGETLLALPGDVIRSQPRPEQLPECITPKYLEVTAKVNKDSVSFYKDMLKTALEKYEKLSCT